MPAPVDVSARRPARTAILPLLIGTGIMLAVTAYPPMLQRADGSADHLALTMLCWAMAAGFTRGVGLVPSHALLRALLSGLASVLGLAAALGLIWLGA